MKVFHKIESACAKQQGRYAMRYVAVRGGYAAASDGRMLAVVPIEREDGDDTTRLRFVDPEALKDARKVSKREAPSVKVNGAVCAAGREYHEPTDAEFPKLGPVVGGDMSKRWHVAIDGALFGRLVDAMAQGSRDNPHGRVVILSVSKNPADPIYVTATDGGGFGALMPVSIEAEDDAATQASKARDIAAAFNA